MDFDQRKQKAAKIFTRLESWSGWAKVNDVYEYQNPDSLPQWLITETARFLALKVISNDTNCELMPSPKIDNVWHTVISMQRLYIAMCAVASKKPFLIDHNPVSAFDHEIDKRARYKKTCELYHEIFGEDPTANGWPVPKSRSVQIFVKNMAKHTYTIDIALDETIGELTRLVSLKTGLPICDIRLIYKFRPLYDDDKTLAECNIEKEATVFLTNVLRGC